MIEIKGSIKQYAWGGYHYLPMMLGTNLGNEPAAELWLGDHKSGSATLIDGSPLCKWIEAAPEYRLGKGLVLRYGCRLPFLFKILDVREPLSIQVHPTIEQAKKGYKREISKGIARDQRSYHDDNHKPELMLALSDFYLLHGFRNVTEALAELSKYKSLHELIKLYSEIGIKGFVSLIFNLPKSNLVRLLTPIIEANRFAYAQNEISKSESLFWFMRAVEIIERDNMDLDAGLLMIFIMNLMYVRKGDVVYQDAGVPHAYLEGQNIELMANSDNVVRCGLTPKHVDTRELLEITDFSPITPATVKGRANTDGSTDYIVPVDDFALREYKLEKGQSLATPEDKGACIWFILSGEVKLDNQQHYSNSGSAFYQRPGEVNVFRAISDAVIYRASASTN
ncbi:mannose-6-phosphate isomerase, class I [Vibrio diazotrophicus]|jgi:mannose-6-phosphate isomerase|uniref:mannose-6-phosphate isomerase n=1 Tax=Vibrio diazotrophicus TaxID=685 RepID=A0A2J8HTD3_VIBDI|nr:mannose-6-phosphate isomerase, class I [Vibrio diazotrophicus]PNI01537.1 mannose-6-phosphate isomerase, class I [Vibrio diazotrophicus]RAS57165.1 mannose-6-phosphate isomerase type 1 [Vibrio diazotrophicus]